MGAKLTLRGAPQMKAKILAVARDNPKRAADSLLKRMNFVLTDAKQNYVPRDKRILMNSGVTNPPVIKGNRISCTITFGGAAEAYAITVHETPSAYDPPSWQGKHVEFRFGGPEYLKRPLFSAAAHLLADIASDLRLK